MSHTITSGGCIDFWRICNASSPSFAVTTSMDCCDRNRETISAKLLLSSIKRTVWVKFGVFSGSDVVARDSPLNRISNRFEDDDVQHIFLNSFEWFFLSFTYSLKNAQRSGRYDALIEPFAFFPSSRKQVEGIFPIR